MRSSIVAVVEVFGIVYRLILHREGIYVCSQFLTQTNVQFQPQIEFFRLVLEVIEEIIRQPLDAALHCSPYGLLIYFASIPVVERDTERVYLYFCQSGALLFSKQPCVQSLVEVDGTSGSIPRIPAEAQFFNIVNNLTEVLRRKDVVVHQHQTAELSLPLRLPECRRFSEPGLDINVAFIYRFQLRYRTERAMPDAAAGRICEVRILSSGILVLYIVQYGVVRSQRIYNNAAARIKFSAFVEKPRERDDARILLQLIRHQSSGGASGKEVCPPVTAQFFSRIYRLYS